MSELKTNIINGYSDADIVQIPTGVSGEYIQELFDGSYNITAIKPADIISMGPWVDARIYGTSKDQVTIAAAIAAIALMSPNTRTLVLVPGIWTISGSISIPTNVSVYVMAGATISVASGSSITFSGPVIAGPYQIFTGSGTITVGATTVLVYSEWDGTAGNTITFQAFPLTPSEAPTEDYQVANKKYVDDVTDLIPKGSIFPYAGLSAPTGFLLCDGSAVSRTTYADLFAITNTTYGVGDGTTTFNVPDLRGIIPVGKNSLDANFTSLGQTGGAATHTLITNEIPSHTHTAVMLTGGNIVPAGSGFTCFLGENQTSSTGGGTAHNNLQPYLVINYIIKT
ncbi:MAG: tail fiber protein [Candidatus Shapirobacteria bacterium]